MALTLAWRSVRTSLSKCFVDAPRTSVQTRALTSVKCIRAVTLLGKPTSRFSIQSRMCSGDSIDLEESPVSPHASSIGSRPKSRAWREQRCLECGEIGHNQYECPLRKLMHGSRENVEKESEASLTRVRSGGRAVARREKRELLCFNCGEAGHKASRCPLPPLRDYGPKGVIVMDAREGSELFCTRCRKGGHTADKCDKERPCYNCGATDHLAKDCPEEERCSKCGQTGHRRADCALGKLCFICGRPGHLAKFCDSPAALRRSLQNS